MTNHVLLNNIDHKDLKINVHRSAELGDGVMHAPIYANEFREIQAYYPIFFYKNEGEAEQHGAYQAVALCGFEQGNNLFLNDKGWDANYIPRAQTIQPFLVGFQQGADGEKGTVVHLDMDSSRITQDGDGVSVFMEHGGNSPYLQQVAQDLDLMHQGHSMNKDFIDSLLKYNLLESFTLDIELNDGSKNRLIGYYIIHEERFYDLDAEALLDLNSKGYVQAIYMTIASLSHIRDLIERKNKTLQPSMS